jgi:hypothetical protein
VKKSRTKSRTVLVAVTEFAGDQASGGILSVCVSRIANRLPPPFNPIMDLYPEHFAYADKLGGEEACPLISLAYSNSGTRFVLFVNTTSFSMINSKARTQRLRKRSLSSNPNTN